MNARSFIIGLQARGVDKFRAVEIVAAHRAQAADSVARCQGVVHPSVAPTRAKIALGHPAPFKTHWPGVAAGGRQQRADRHRQSYSLHKYRPKKWFS